MWLGSGFAVAGPRPAAAAPPNSTPRLGTSTCHEYGQKKKKKKRKKKKEDDACMKREHFILYILFPICDT